MGATGAFFFLDFPFLNPPMPMHFGFIWVFFCLCANRFTRINHSCVTYKSLIVGSPSTSSCIVYFTNVYYPSFPADLYLLSVAVTTRGAITGGLQLSENKQYYIDLMVLDEPLRYEYLGLVKTLARQNKVNLVMNELELSFVCANKWICTPRHF